MPDKSMTFKAITNPEKIKALDLPGPMIRVSFHQDIRMNYWMTPEQATDAGIRLVNLAAMARDARGS